MTEREKKAGAHGLLKKEKMARGVGGTIIRGRRLFEIFQPKGGDYSREAINRGTANIGGNTFLY